MIILTNANDIPHLHNYLAHLQSLETTPKGRFRRLVVRHKRLSSALRDKSRLTQLVGKAQVANIVSKPGPQVNTNWYNLSNSSDVCYYNGVLCVKSTKQPLFNSLHG